MHLIVRLFLLRYQNIQQSLYPVTPKCVQLLRLSLLAQVSKIALKFLIVNTKCALFSVVSIVLVAGINF